MLHLRHVGGFDGWQVAAVKMFVRYGLKII